jgi:tetratricopeptide (TPR) repeat protein
METWHISADLLRRFIGRATTNQESMRLVRHLLRGCEQCGALTQRILGESGYWGFLKRAAGFSAEEYDQAFETALHFATQEERRAAVARLRGWGQWAALSPLLPEERDALVAAEKDFHHWGFYRALLDASRWFSINDPREAVDIVQLAIRVAERLDPAAVGGEQSAMDLRAKGWAILGNARRLASDLDGARQALNEAWRLHEQGTQDPLEKAFILGLDASWVRVMGDFETAETILEEALKIYGTANDHHMQGRTLLKMGDAIGYADPSAASPTSAVRSNSSTRPGSRAWSCARNTTSPTSSTTPAGRRKPSPSSTAHGPSTSSSPTIGRSSACNGSRARSPATWASFPRRRTSSTCCGRSSIPAC